MNKYMNSKEILDIAIRIEENGQRFYESAAESDVAVVIKKQLRILASWEDGHIAKLQDLFGVYTEEDSEFPLHFSPEEDTSLYLQSLADNHIFIKNSNVEKMVSSCSTVKELLDIARRFEQDSVDFYSSLAEKVVDPEAKKVLLQIADEERAHVKQVESTYSEEF